ncbi:MAG: hypothetical protein ACXVGR_14325 [Mycobacteriaceae bacterium]
MFGLVLYENWRWVVRGLLLLLGIFWTVGSLIESRNQSVGTTIALLVVGIALILLYLALRSRNWGGWVKE